MTKKDTKAPVAFVSYKWESDEHVGWVESFARDLRSRGIDAMLDLWEVGLGQSFSDYMTSAIARCDAFLFIITEKSVRSVEGATEKGGAIRFEVQLATARKVSGDRFRFIGILREGDRPPTHLSDARYADFRNDSRYEYELAMLVADLKGHREKPELPSTLNFSLIAEAAVFRIWRGLPHGRNFLIAESVPKKLQGSISRGLVRVIDRESKGRGYSFGVVEINLDNTSQKGIKMLFDTVSYVQSTTPFDLEPLLEVGATIVFQKTKITEINVLVLLLTSSQQFGPELQRTLHLLRACVQEVSFRTNSVTLSIVLMLADLKLVDDSHSSPWFNIYEFVQL